MLFKQRRWGSLLLIVYSEKGGGRRLFQMSGMMNIRKDHMR